MKGVIILIVVLAIGLGMVQGMKLFKAKSDFTERVDRELNFVDSSPVDAVKHDLVQEAQKYGIQLAPENIQVSMEDTEQRTVAQKLVANKLGTQYTNKKVTIKLNYTARILGIPLGQEITSSKIKQVEAPRMPMPAEERKLLDPTGASAGVDTGQ
jgi:preprotein translocase subunit SecF